MKKIILALTFLVSTISAQLVIHQIETTPEFFRPGEMITVKVLAEKPPAGNSDATPWVEFAGVLSTDATWSNNDFLFMYAGGQNIEPLANVDGTKGVWNPTTIYGLGAYSFQMMVPATYSTYSDLYIIVKGRQFAQLWWGGPRTVSELAGAFQSERAFKVEVAGNKYAAYNTASMQGGKVSKSRIVIVDSKPELILSATPSTSPNHEFSTQTLDVAITATGNNADQATINYKIINADLTETTGTLTNGSGTVQISQSAKIEAWVNDGVYWSYSVNSWQYDQVFPPTVITLDTAGTFIPEGDTVIYTTLGKIIHLATSNGERLTYQFNNGLVGNINTSSGNINLAGTPDTTRLTVTASGASVSPDTAIWVFIRELPPLQIIADPAAGTGFTFDTTVHLSVVNGGVAVPTAKIYYLIETDPAAIPTLDSTTGILYDSTIGILIDTTCRIFASAYDPTIPTVEGIFNYRLDLVATTITVPTEDGVRNLKGDTASTTVTFIHFGETLNLLPTSNPWSLYYKQNGGTEQLFVSGDTLKILSTDADTTSFTFRTAGHGYAPDTLSIMFVRDTVEVLTADPAGLKFIGTQWVNLNLSGTWKNAKIYYTLDGSTPDSGSGISYSTAFSLTSTTTVKAIAYADFAVPSQILSERYTAAIGSGHSIYQDANSDGKIDHVHMALTKAAGNLPDSIHFLNPVDLLDTVSVPQSALSFNSTNDTLVALLSTPFDYDGRTGTTAITTGDYGLFFGAEYYDQPFAIGDGVAPLIRYGSYVPGKYHSSGTTREADTVTIYFSENCTLSAAPLAIRWELQNGTEYTAHVRTISVLGDRMMLAVDSLTGVQYPSASDSLSFTLFAQATDSLGNVQLVESNLRAPLDVKALPPIIRSISSKNPTTTPIPADLVSPKYPEKNGFVIVVDYMTLLSNTENLDGKAMIIDPLGNVIAKSRGLSDNSPMVCDLLSTNNRTRLVFYWNGKNERGRFVAPGSYFLKVEARDSNNERHTREMPIGVKGTKE